MEPPHLPMLHLIGMELVVTESGIVEYAEFVTGNLIAKGVILIRRVCVFFLLEERNGCIDLLRGLVRRALNVPFSNSITLAKRCVFTVPNNITRLVKSKWRAIKDGYQNLSTMSKENININSFFIFFLARSFVFAVCRTFRSSKFFYLL